MARSVRRGFTLIELLVVIAIIAILAAILFPVFAQAREAARKATCQSNLKQIGSAYMMYTQDYDELFPINDGNNSSPAWYTQPADSRGVASQARLGVWTTTLQPYIKNWKVFQCPSTSVDTSVLNAPLNAGAPQIPISYTPNGQLGNTSTASVQAVSSCIMVWEGTGKSAMLNYTIATPTFNPSTPARPPHPSYTGIASGCTFYVPSGTLPSYWVHGQGSNYLFVDGHVKYRPVTGDYNISPWTSVDSKGVPNGGVWVDGTGCAWLYRPTLQE